jgi:phosphatidylinositol glycan class Q protein
MKDEANSKQWRSAEMAWSVGVDILLGVIASLWLLSHDNMSLICNFINDSGQGTVEVVKTQLVWLMGVPAGFKLNSALDQFLGEFFLYLINIWSAYLQAVVAPILPIVVSFIALTSCLGFSVLLALSADMLSLMTFHIYCFYVFAAKIYSVQVYALGSLWRLFTGKKWNVLRNRIDSYEYKVDQLLLGTLLFTVLLFLLPTVAMYYLVFSLLRTSVLAVHVMINISINLLARIPIYGLLIWLFDPLQLPGGIKLNLKTHLQSWYYFWNS